MKYSLLFLFSFLSFSLSSQVFWQDDFEGTTPDVGGGTRTVSVGSSTDGTCCTSDRFVRDANFAAGTCCGCGVAYTNISNTFAFGGEDLDGTAPCSNATQTITWTGIDISGRSNLEFLGLFGIREVTSYESTDQLMVQFRIDGAPSLSDGVCFVPNPTLALNDLGLDADCDGTIDVVDNDLLTTALSEYTFPLNATGTTLEIVFSATINGGGEEFVIDNFRIQENAALPVELTYFKAEKREAKVNLTWETANELNNEFFSIEHSIDGENFESIGIVEGAGTTDEPQNYSFLHKTPKSGLNYYRLLQVDFDGKLNSSKIEVVDFNRNSTFGFSPNPFTDEVTITLEKALLKNTQFNVFNMQGQLVYTGIIPEGQLQEVVNLSSIPSGAYTLRIGFGEEAISQRIVKF